MRREPVTAASSMFTFYDIESLTNAFTLCAFTPQKDPQATHRLEVFFLIDDKCLMQDLQPAHLSSRIIESNPSMGRVEILYWDLSTEAGATRLACLVGASTAYDVCDPDSRSRLPGHMRPVCDTDADYDPMEHPFLAGYNSQNYDTSMLAYFLAESFPIDPENQSGPLFQPTTAAALREHNNVLFTEHVQYMPRALGFDTAEARFRQNMLASGRHIDVSTFNEVQIKSPLKRHLGTLGRQILESEKLSHDSVLNSSEDLLELLAYNVSDCVGLAQLFQDPTYSNAFDLKAGLLAAYDETRLNRDGSVRRDRLRIDSSSAKMVGRILSPYGNLEDQPVVSFDYPHPEIAAQRGVPVTNVLDDTEKFFRAHIADPDSPEGLTEAQRLAWEQFSQVLAFYREIEGRNFNDSEQYFPIAQAHQQELVDQAQKILLACPQLFAHKVPEASSNEEILTAYWQLHVSERARFLGVERDLSPGSLKEINKRPLNLPYFRADASPDSCFITFSTGGIHGAEANVSAQHRLQAKHLQEQIEIARATAAFEDAQQFLQQAKEQYNALTMSDGTVVDKALVLIGSTPDRVRYRKPKSGDDEQARLQREQLEAAQQQYPDPVDLLALQAEESTRYDVRLDDGTVLHAKTVLTSNRKQLRTQPAQALPEIFEQKADGSNAVRKVFTRTSAGLVVHEDFTSYYPNLLRNMRAFYNADLGEDRYARIFFQKEELGERMKDPSLTETQRTALANARNGTKLILNSASGAGDAAHNTPIRMNNTIIAMRIIGQLLTWRIGQAQTLAGGRIISTNTDGLYSVIDHQGKFTVETNNAVLEQQQKAIGVDIEPELMFLISKDSNNRMELMPARGADPALIEPENALRGDGGFEIDELKITAAGGGSLACFKGPLTTKSLSHPAVLDHGLAHYLKRIVAAGESALWQSFDHELGRALIEEAVDHQDPVQTLRMFQNMMVASRGSITYPFAVPAIDQHDEDADPLAGASPLQMYNRVFVVKPGTPGAVNLHMAAAPSISETVQRSRAKAADEQNRAAVRRDPVAARMLAFHGWAATRAEKAENPDLQLIPADRDVTVRKISGIDPSWSMRIVNDDLHCLSPQAAAELIDSLDLQVYTEMLEATYSKNWRNT